MTFAALPMPADLVALLQAERRRWCVTGASGFIGSHIAETLLAAGQDVVALDDFSTGRRATASQLAATGGARFRLIEGDVRDPSAVAEAMAGAGYVVHLAALGSVPASIDDPVLANAINVEGCVQVFNAASKLGVRGLVYASSSAVYGADPSDMKREGTEGRVLSPYAASKRANELYAEAFGASFALQAVGLRFFNVYGPRQDPDGPYAAVIPRWLDALIRGATVTVNGDGETTRDFCHVADVVQANLRAALAGSAAAGSVLNVGSGTPTSLNQLLAALRTALAASGWTSSSAVHYGPFRTGDIRHSLADISAARRVLGYTPQWDLARGLAQYVPWVLAAETGQPEVG